jgi:hypothetical protein
MGGAIYIRNGTPYIGGCVFASNWVTGSDWNYGGAIYIDATSVMITDCLFNRNYATTTRSVGGAIANFDGQVTLVNSTFCDNWATGSMFGTGGGFHTEGGTASVSNCIFWDNRDNGGTDESAQLHNWSTLDINYSCLQGWTGAYGGTGNIGSNPQFLDPDGPDNDASTWEDNDFRLTMGVSPCIDAADYYAVLPDHADRDHDGNTAEPTPLDLARGLRFMDDPATPDNGNGYPPIIDMGAYEVQVPTGVPDQNQTAGLEGFRLWPNPTRGAVWMQLPAPSRAPGVVGIFDVTGRLINRLQVPVGARIVRWDGTDRSDRPLAPGVYYIRIAAGDRLESRRVLLIH